jgi:integrase
MATKRERNGRWHYVIKRSSLPRPVYLSFDTEAEGDAYVARVEKLLDHGIIPEELQRVEPEKPATLREHSRKYLAEQHVSQTDRDNLRLALDALPAGIETRELSFAWATAWITAMKREANLSPITIRHRVGALARCFDWIAAHGAMISNPLRQLPQAYATYTPEDARAAKQLGGRHKIAEERDRRLQEGEEEAIRAILAGEKAEGKQRALAQRHTAELALLFDLALETAMRMREMFTLTADQVDLKQATIFLDKTKNGDKRQVPLTSVAVKLLRAHLKKMKDGGRLFPWWGGDRKKLAKTTSQLSRQFGRIFDAAGCGDLNFHDLRHEATSRFFERTTLDALEIAKITGHRSPRSLMRYAKLRASKLATRLW